MIVRCFRADPAMLLVILLLLLYHAKEILSWDTIGKRKISKINVFNRYLESKTEKTHWPVVYGVEVEKDVMGDSKMHHLLG